jgi:anti-sigma factor RsiW
MPTEQLREHERVFEQLDRYLDAELEDGEAAVVAAHLSQCDICRQRLAELQGVEQAYARELARGEPAPDYRDRLLKGLCGEWHSARSAAGHRRTGG